MKIQILSRKDAALCEDLCAAVFGESERALAQSYIQTMFSDDFRRPCFVIAKEGNGDVIGVASFSEELFTLETWGISWVCVHSDYRNQGVAKALVRFCLDEIVKICPRFTAILATYPNKTKLYEDMGFIAAGKDHCGGSYMIKHVGV